MRPQLLSPRTRSLVKTQHHRALLSSTHTLRYPRKDASGTKPQSTPRLSKRSSSSAPPASEGSPPASPPHPNPAEPPPAEDPPEEKPKRAYRSRSSSTKESDASPPLPAGLNILWTPEGGAWTPGPSNVLLPHPEVYQEILHNLHITFHPQTQHKATYSPPSGPLVEPTFALYSPIEGGEVYIDATVREIARQAGADVVVLDAVQLAAGACGHFGKAASALQIPDNPLHFPETSGQSTRSVSRAPVFDEDEDEDDSPSFFTPPRMTLQVLTPMIAGRSGRAFMSSSGRDSGAAKLRSFFENLVNITAPKDGSSNSSPATRKPRIIYIRDFPTLAPSSSTWYPPLLHAVRKRRQGAITRSTSPVLHPTTIIFGITPALVPPPSATSSGPGPRGLVNMYMNHQSTTGSTSSKTPKSQYGEDSVSEKAREQRMLFRLKRWAHNELLPQDLPLIKDTEEIDESGNAKSGPEVVTFGGPEGISGLPAALQNMLATARSRIASDSGSPDARKGFFRTSLVLPHLRNFSLERTMRMARRREINELTMRMAVTTVGGELSARDPAYEPPEREGEQNDTLNVERQMWEDWGKSIVNWPTVRRIADRVVGSVIRKSWNTSPFSLEPTPIPWDEVYKAWAEDKISQELWDTMLSDPASKILREHTEDDEGKSSQDDEEPEDDEVIERLKRDPELDSHEQRLLGSIVDTKSLTTTFSQVHLPEHTIDSVRTIVSLPLLHPMAFQYGVLKQHQMSGCLLFGPPGTGKTLVVRALAKEAGCRMLAITPSDVMDMYVGEGEKLVRAVFSLARKLSPCVVFIDELDALFGARSSRDNGAAIAHRGLITEFMQEMDGIKSAKDTNVIVIGATNRPFDLDDAVLRRLPRRLLVDLPGEKERTEILKIMLRDETLAEDVDFHVLAKKTESFSGSDLKHLCVAAALDAVKERVTVPWRSSPVQTSAAAIESPAADYTSAVATSATPEAEPAVSDVTNPAPAETDVRESPVAASTAESGQATTPAYSRTLKWPNFEKALKEITPSASELLGTLADLRKWNEEFGEGRKARKQLMWGKGRFGFTIEPPNDKGAGRVSPTTASAPPASAFDDSID
ncbi:AAA-domain-containing protein [Wolfiporia cocos MD-104 SS10]|uniref:AAA-domain-containing protein n=1 Tax=Wolfiporia cocos (strain MD-104) TaxID=742152 RepID=A0A2H3J788_WOLCO|nr:AAA-domain-containing protein [Wolfiporia cocos MD-104 SS10]